jgi:pimeloyl-ACP methyl ester carboxylesterase
MVADFRFSVRTQANGGRRAASVRELSPALTGYTWLVFIHGANVSQARARDQWSELRPRLRVHGARDRIQVGTFEWPSDLYRPKWDPRNYGRTVHLATEAGGLLGDFLARQPTRDVVLVGHSLGALVTVRAAQTMHGMQRKPRCLALLGAAIQATQMEPITGLYNIVPLATHEGVAFSHRDYVLRLPFNTGDWAASALEPKKAAVGLYGEPHSRKWHAVDSRINHHDYFRVDVSADLVANLMEATGPVAARQPTRRRIARRVVRRRTGVTE